LIIYEAEDFLIRLLKEDETKETAETQMLHHNRSCPKRQNAHGSPKVMWLDRNQNSIASLH
jgi:hypothetical protein